MLRHSQPEVARRLAAWAQEDVNRRWKLYEHLASQPGNGTEAPAPKPVPAAKQEEK